MNIHDNMVSGKDKLQNSELHPVGKFQTEAH